MERINYANMTKEDISYIEKIGLNDLWVQNEAVRVLLSAVSSIGKLRSIGNSIPYLSPTCKRKEKIGVLQEVPSDM